MILTQPNVGFGDKINEELRSLENETIKWEQLDFAVAWINQRGATYLKEAFKFFLGKGGNINAIVGLDFSHTSKEGLSCLLDMEIELGGITTHVFYDENPACTFHPKIYLFKNKHQAQLYVGSNNMTGAGLSTNIEMSLGFAGSIEDKTILDVSSTLLMWRDVHTEPRTRRLNHEFLELLCSQGYVKTESDIQKTLRPPLPTKDKETLFGRSKHIEIKGKPIPHAEPNIGKERKVLIGSNLLMRVRPRRNGQQIQISMKIYEDLFMNYTKSVTSAKTGEHHAIGFNYTHRNGIKQKNTARFEAPELRGINNPVLRFKWVATPYSHLQYEVYDADTDTIGINIYKQLSSGITTPSVTRLERINENITVLSKKDPKMAQWYRLI
ncbi:hypothetical protein ACTG1T_03145 [Aeromonas veronii]|uniref:hypothetical protein n=1 Tax=Aeromonas veronii TaxID=654 RepID=UPI003F7AE9F2